jgi:dihydrofolate reductase
MQLTVINHVTLDGVMQGPGRPDEDTRDGFAHGGWAVPYNDEVMGRVMGEGMARTAGLLLGRRTYEDFAGFWPRQQDNPYTRMLDETQKYVVSTTLAEPLPWQNSTLLRGDAVEAVGRLKEQPGGDLAILGSGALIRSLLPHGLIDRFTLMINPLVLGSGRRLFDGGGVPAPLRLVDSTTTTTGVIIATYEPVR